MTALDQPDEVTVPTCRSTFTQELAFAVETVAHVGTALAAATRTGGASATAKKDGTPVTDVDIRGNEYIHAAVAERWPDDVVLGEEDVSEHRNPPPCQRVWVADPVDGTWLLAAGLPWTVVSLALVVDGQPVVAVVHDPHTDTTLTATLDGGAWLNGRRLAVNAVATITPGAVLALPGGNVPAFDAVGMFGDAVRAGADVVTVGSAVQDASLVARGFAAGAVYPYTSPWDMAAVTLLTTEAGGCCTALNGGMQRYDCDPIRGAVLSNGLVHGELVDMVARWQA